MSSDTMVAEDTLVAFGADTFKRNAKLYVKHKRVVDAIATGVSKKQYDSFDDAIAAIRLVWDALEDQLTNGGAYTPPVELEFGSDNASQIAGALLGRKVSVASVRKAFASHGK